MDKITQLKDNITEINQTRQALDEINERYALLAAAIKGLNAAVSIITSEEVTAQGVVTTRLEHARHSGSDGQWGLYITVQIDDTKTKFPWNSASAPLRVLCAKHHDEFLVLANKVASEIKNSLE